MMAQGIDYDLLSKITRYVQEKRYKWINAITVSQNGQLVYEKYFNEFDEQTPQHVASIIKSIVSLMIGVCIKQKKIASIDDPISKYLGEYFGANKHPHHKRITIRNLLTLSSGIYWQFGIHASQPLMSRMKTAENWLEEASDLPVAYLPGSKFYYKEIDVYLLMEIIQVVCGESVEQAVGEFLYGPLGIDVGSLNCTIDTRLPNTENISLLNSLDLHKLGWLCLNNGTVNGVELLDKVYLEQSTTKQIDTGEFSKSFHSDYGFLWWIYDNAYFARGFGGKELAIFPEKDLIVVIQATAQKIHKEYLDIIFDLILNAFLRG